MIVPSWSALTWAGLPVSNWLGVSPNSPDALHLTSASNAAIMTPVIKPPYLPLWPGFQNLNASFMIFLSFLVVPGGMTCPRVFVSLVLAGCRSPVDSGYVTGRLGSVAYAMFLAWGRALVARVVCVLSLCYSPRFFPQVTQLPIEISKLAFDLIG